MLRDYRDDELRGSVVFPVSVKEAIRKSCLDDNFKNHLLGPAHRDAQVGRFQFAARS